MDGLAALEREHAEIDVFLARLVPAWNDIARDPARREAHALGPDVASLAAIFERHLAWEEEHLIPRLEELLGAAGFAEVRSEMKARRDR